MVAVLQRVSASSVRVEERVVGAIEKGLTVLLGVMKGDTDSDVEKMVAKIVNLRIFADNAGKMNRSVCDVDGAMLVISQFTLGADVRRGRRPSFEKAANPQEAKRLYERFIELSSKHLRVEQGVFGKSMDVEIHNDGPVTIVIDSKEL